ncbi:hypothetical protein [Salmonirosea aquatica]|uniref:Uncharacterized protein n=1 Tax=Salmonirosea aquatica TaxID=2654236 RepID=A0A7C9FBV6_9BACT|nr:hypothetical protein [Cytophagaceae bacterium SJW1-29]MPR37144.1 hypothetical protein [Cytophagaceae bacterium SJW1-29]
MAIKNLRFKKGAIIEIPLEGHLHTWRKVKVLLSMKEKCFVETLFPHEGFERTTMTHDELFILYLEASGAKLKSAAIMGIVASGFCLCSSRRSSKFYEEVMYKSLQYVVSKAPLNAGKLTLS